MSKFKFKPKKDCDKNGNTNGERAARGEQALTVYLDAAGITDLVFASPAEFMAHHLNISVREATARLYQYSPTKHWVDEVHRSGTRLIKREEFA